MKFSVCNLGFIPPGNSSAYVWSTAFVIVAGIWRLYNVQKNRLILQHFECNIGKTTENFVIFLTLVLKVYVIYLGCVLNSTNFPHGDIY